MDLEGSLLKAIDDAGQIADSGDFAASMSSDHLAVVGVIKSLEASEMILVKASGHGTHTANAQACVGSQSRWRCAGLLPSSACAHAVRTPIGEPAHLRAPAPSFIRTGHRSLQVDTD